MERSTLYKVFAGYFHMLDECGNAATDYKRYTLFKRTYGIVFFLNAATKGRCHAVYFARDDRGWNFRTTFPTGTITEESNQIRIKTRYNSFVWDSTMGPTQEQADSLFQWIKENGETYIPGFTQYCGVKEYLERNQYR